MFIASNPVHMYVNTSIIYTTYLHRIHDYFKTSNGKSIWNPKAVVIQMPNTTTIAAAMKTDLQAKYHNNNNVQTLTGRSE